MNKNIKTLSLLGFLGCVNQGYSIQPISKEAPVLIESDSISYDKELGSIVAKGKVEVSQGARLLTADSVSYDEKLDRVVATGNVILREPDGEVVEGEYVELTDQMKEGLIKQIRLLLSDDSKMVARSGYRKQGEYTALDGAIYSPCKVCKTDPTAKPLWQLRSQDVLWDEKAKNVIYQNARLEFWGVPVLWTPFMRHADPSVKRRSGFLSPYIGGGINTGGMIVSPYFIEIAPDSDLTITPMFNTQSALILGAEYRKRFSKGVLEMEASGGRSKRQSDPAPISVQPQPPVKEFMDNRWHVAGKARFDLSDTWRLKAQVERASDQTYLKRYEYWGLSEKKALTSYGMAERFLGRTYGTVQAYTFQGLRPGDSARTSPNVLPSLRYVYTSEPGVFGGRWTADTSVLSIYRQEGVQSRRLSSTVGWERPFATGWGDIYTVGTQVRGDFYHADQFSHKTQSKGRGLPQAYVDWRMPFVQYSDKQQILVEPILGLIAAPTYSQDSSIYNEDSRIIELDDGNIFSLQRFPGLDVLDGGTRFNYGVHMGVYGGSVGQTDLFLGQTYHLSTPEAFLQKTGFGTRLSDYVGRVKWAPYEFLSLGYRFRADQSSFKFKRNEVTFEVGKPIFKVKGDFVDIDQVQNSQDGIGQRQLTLGLNSQFHKFWKGELYGTRDLARGGGALKQGIGLTYQDECFTTTASIERSFYEDRDLKKETRFMIRVKFKNLSDR